MPGNEIILPLDYREDEVVPAQRARFRSGTRLRLGLLFAVVTLALLALARMTDGSARPGGPAALVPALVLIVCFAGVLLFSWRFSPLIDFRTNPIWKRKHRLRLTPDALFLEPPEGGPGTELPWRSLRRVLETQCAFVLVYRSEREFLIVPRRVLGAHEAEFRHSAGVVSCRPSSRPLASPRHAMGFSRHRKPGLGNRPPGGTNPAGTGRSDLPR